MSPLKVEPLAWLMTWYRSRCDGEWEHEHGLRIGTLDNPGWSLDVDLRDTPYEKRVLAEEMVERSEDDWVFIEAKDAVFRARGGPENLAEMVGLFAAFVSTEDDV